LVIHFFLDCEEEDEEVDEASEWSILRWDKERIIITLILGITPRE
jgi:hypothetical protein